MKVTERVGERLKKDVVPRVEWVLQQPVPEKILQSTMVQRVGNQALKLLERLTELVQKAEEVTLRTPKKGEPMVSDRIDDIRKELESLLHPAKAEAPAGAKAEMAAEGPIKPPAPGPAAKKAPPRKMPEVIKASGGKRIPAAVANRAVKSSDTEFKPKKGKRT